SVSCFSLYCSAAPRDLPSFPTRRSSDLVGVVAAGVIGAGAALAEHAHRQFGQRPDGGGDGHGGAGGARRKGGRYVLADARHVGIDRKSTRLNSSHVSISYAVFCLKKKTK